MKRRTFIQSLIAAIAMSMAGFATELPPKHAEEPPWVEEMWQEIQRSFTMFSLPDGCYIQVQ